MMIILRTAAATSSEVTVLQCHDADDGLSSDWEVR